MINKLGQWFRKTETILLGILLYSILMVYVYQFLKISDKFVIFKLDEIIYYMEAKAISAYNIYQTPVSLDGNTSIIGNFGGHGISYAIKDGWLAKLFFQAENPPMILIKFITSFSMLALVLLFKPLSLNIRLKMALVIVTTYVMFSYTFSYMQETIHFLFAVIALRVLYRLYEEENMVKNKYLYYYLIIIIIAITFRYTWFIWGLGLLPLAINFKSFTKWILVLISLVVFGILYGHYFYAPYPYWEIVTDRIFSTEGFSILDLLNNYWEKFTQNLQLFLSPDAIRVTTMRYFFILLLLISTWYSIVKRNRFTIACTLIAWGYFFSSLMFYSFLWEGNSRILAIMNPLLAFSLIGKCNSLFFFPIIAIQLFFFPGIVEEKNQYLELHNSWTGSPSLRISKDASSSKIKDMVTEDRGVTIVVPIEYVTKSRNCFVNFPLVTRKGHPIHYNIFVNGNDMRKTKHSDYLLTTIPFKDANFKLLYNDEWMYFYRIKN